MKQYHTEIAIDAPVAKVWDVLVDFPAYPLWNPLVGWLTGDFAAGGRIRMFIKPLNSAFHATVTDIEEHRSFTWMGARGASWLLSGEHYYRLEQPDDYSTRLLHGEYFRGLGSEFIGRTTLRTMEEAFTQHNLSLKRRVEHG